MKDMENTSAEKLTVHEKNKSLKKELCSKGYYVQEVGQTDIGECDYLIVSCVEPKNLVRNPNARKAGKASIGYRKTVTTAKITMSDSGSIVTPVATLEDAHGGMCQIIEDDHCYEVCLRQKDGTYSPTTHIFKEAFELLKILPNLI